MAHIEIPSSDSITESSGVAGISSGISSCLSGDEASEVLPTSSEEPLFSEAMAKPMESVEESSPLKGVTKCDLMCNICGKNFFHIGHLKKHLKIHSKKDVPELSNSSESVTVQSDLLYFDDSQEDMIVLPSLHFMDGASVCPEQSVDDEEVSFRDPIEKSLPEHKQTINRNFVCVICGKGFGRNSHLKRHFKVHEKDGMASSSSVAQAGYFSLEDGLSGSSDVSDRSHHNRLLEMHENKIISPTNEIISSSLIVKAGSLILETGLSGGSDVSNSLIKQNGESVIRSKSPVFVNMSETIVKAEPPSSFCSSDVLSIKSETVTTLDSTENVEVKIEPPFLDFEDELVQGESSVTNRMYNAQLQTHANIVNSCAKEEIEKTNECSVCNKQFGCSSDLKRHMKLHVGQADLSLTDSMSESEEDKDGDPLDEMETSITDDVSAPDEEKYLSCPVCSKAFGRRSNLNRHMKLHPGVEYYDCETCGKRFYESVGLQTHIDNVHCSDKEGTIHECSICSKQFARSSNLKRHMKLHVGGETYACRVCGRSFLEKNNLKSHEKVHAEVEASIEEGLVKRHVIEETSEEYYECEQCGKSYQLISSVKAHINTVHAEAKVLKCFECSFCGKEFGRNSHLKRHLKLHVGGETYACRMCGKVFKQNGNLKAHIQMVHLKKMSE